VQGAAPDADTCSDLESISLAGLRDRIELRITPALETLRGLPPEAVIDLVFTDDDTAELRTSNDKVAAGDRVEAVVPTAFDGLAIARKL